MAEFGIALPERAEVFVCIESPPGLGKLPPSHCPMLFCADICAPETRSSWDPASPLTWICMSSWAVATGQQLKNYHTEHGNLTFHFQNKHARDASLNSFGVLWCVLAWGMRRCEVGGFISVTLKSVPPIGRSLSMGKKQIKRTSSLKNTKGRLQKLCLRESIFL